MKCRSGSKRGHTWVADDPTKPWRRVCEHGDAVGAIDKMGRVQQLPAKIVCR